MQGSSYRVRHIERTKRELRNPSTPVAKSAFSARDFQGIPRSHSGEPPIAAVTALWLMSLVETFGLVSPAAVAKAR